MLISFCRRASCESGRRRSCRSDDDVAAYGCASAGGAVAKKRVLGEAEAEPAVLDCAAHGVAIDLCQCSSSVLDVVKLDEAHWAIVLDPVRELAVALAGEEALAQLILQRGRGRGGDAAGEVADKEGGARRVLVD